MPEGAASIPEVLGRHGFVRESELGQGAWGTVIKARKMASNNFPKILIGQVVAIKCVRSDDWAKAPRPDGSVRTIVPADEIEALQQLMSTEAQYFADPSRMQTVLDRLRQVRGTARLFSLLFKDDHAAVALTAFHQLLGGAAADPKSVTAILRLLRKAHISLLDSHEINAALQDLQSFSSGDTPEDVDAAQLLSALQQLGESSDPATTPSPEVGGLTRLLGDFSDGGWSCLVLEHCEAGNLRSVIDSSIAVYQEPNVRQLARPLIRGLLFMEKKGVMHRDVKPENILLRKEWNPTKGDTAPDVCLTDFTLSTNKQHGTAVGTPLYISPERLAHNVYDFEAESWAAGIVIFELYFGKRPFGDSEKGWKPLYECQLAFKNPKAIFQHVHQSMDDMSVPLMDLLSGMLHPDPKERMSLAEVACHEWWWWYEVDHESATSPWQKERKLKCLVEQAKALLQLCKEFPDHAAALCALAATVLEAVSGSLRSVNQVDATVEKVRAMEDELLQLQLEVATMMSNAADTAPIDSASIWSGVAAVVEDVHLRCVSSESSGWTTALGGNAVHASTALLWHLMDVSLEERLERLEVGRLRRTMQRRVFVERNIWVLMMMEMWMCLQ